jgi:hypothetical protein
MILAVIDTNVLLVANGQHDDASPECVTECVHRLTSIQTNGVTVIDDGFRLFREYQHKTQLNPAKGVGDVFLKWLLRNAGDASRIHQVTITETGPDEFAEFPDFGLQPSFDAPDRKFAAVANTHPAKPAIWQAVDCKWLNWWPALQDKGVKVQFLCPDDVSRFYQRKFPMQYTPLFPNP